MWIIIILFIIYLIWQLPSAFRQWSDMDYIKHLEDMGVFIDEERTKGKL